MNFYACIIGSEILNGRRVDKHFEFVKAELKKYGHELYASFIVKDEVELIANVYKLVKDDENSVLFSFGGIGSTPDDLTRSIAADIFTCRELVRHPQFELDIKERFGDEAYPHRIFMSDLPENSSLLFNPVNNMSGFSLEDRFFFVPGFPQMAHPMLSEVIQRLFSKSEQKYRLTLLAQTSENTLIDIMKQIPQDIELSSLPILKPDNISVEISLSSTSALHVEKYFKLFTNFLDTSKITYNLI